MVAMMSRSIDVRRINIFDIDKEQSNRDWRQQHIEISLF
jgi:hypothetical protein